MDSSLQVSSSVVDSSTPLAASGSSLLSLLGFDSSSCGYCASGLSVAARLLGHRFSADLYERLMDRHWRRCGSQIYNPINEYSCCQLYSIRLDATAFACSSTQRRVLRRMEIFLAGEPIELADGKFKFAAHQTNQKQTPAMAPAEPQQKQQQNQQQQRKKQKLQRHSNLPNSTNSPSTELHSAVVSALSQLYSSSIDSLIPRLRIYGSSNPRAYSSNAALLVFHHLLAGETKVGPAQNSTAHTISLESAAFGIAAALRNLLDAAEYSIQSNACGYVNFEKIGNLQIQTIRPDSNAAEIHQQTTTTQPQTQPEQTQSCTRTPRQLSIVVSPASFTDEKYELYLSYQRAIHNDSPSRDSFNRFLCQANFFPPPTDSNGASSSGNYHMEYRIGTELIAVGVIDLLPHSLSSVYLFYEPKYKFLELGKWTAIKEIEKIQQENQLRKQFKYYYLGYFSPNVEKLKYKREFKPAMILCNFTMKWIPMEEFERNLSNFNIKRMKLNEMENIDIDNPTRINYQENHSNQMQPQQQDNQSEFRSDITKAAKLIGLQNLHTIIIKLD